MCKFAQKSKGHQAWPECRIRAPGCTLDTSDLKINNWTTGINNWSFTNISYEKYANARYFVQNQPCEPLLHDKNGGQLLILQGKLSIYYLGEI